MARAWYSMHLARCPATVRATRALCAAALLLAPILEAAELDVRQVDFAPAVSAKLEEYGEAEGAAVRDAIVAAVVRESRQNVVPAGLS
ncbi:MAG TPA: hypothetical protein VNH41_10005, partial [Steroidobacteraceae bacterium]|nr:hypothetical protein [Steroidobacteraceae bacterium]